MRMKAISPGATAAGGGSRGRSFQQLMVEYGALMAFVLLLGFNIFFTPNFFQFSSFLLIVKQSTSLVFVVVGMTLVISLGGTDISVGSTMALSGIVTALLLQSGVGFLPSVAAAFAVCILVGAFNGLVIAKVGIQPIILTLVMQIVLRGVTVMLAKSTVIPLTKYRTLYQLGIYRMGGSIPIQVVFFALAALSAYVLIRKASLGKYVEAIGGSRRAAHLCGIKTGAIIVAVYVLSALFAAFAGLLEMARTAALDPNLLGVNFELDAIASVAVGGTSMKGGKARVLGSMMGCVIMTLIGTTVNMNNIPYAVSNIIKAGIIIVSLAIQRRAAD